MRIISSLAATILVSMLGAPAATAQRSDRHPARPGSPRHGVCVDAPLRLTFDRPPRLGSSGVIQVHGADGAVADSIDLADARSYQRTIGDAVSDTGVPHSFTYYPVIVSGTGATIHLHHRLDYDRTYYVTVDPSVFPGSPGIQDPKAWSFTTKMAPPRPGARRLSVAADGSGDFCTVQGAIDFVPEGNTRPVVIDVRPGTYTEIDYVRADRPHITIRGEDRDRTVVEYANNNRLNGDTALSGSPTPGDVCPRQALPGHDTYNCWRSSFGVEASDFTLENITLRNTTPYGGSQAEAFRGNADRVLLDRVTLRSFQDTLRLQGRGLVTNSYIEGDVDFVWGVGSVFVQRTELRSLHGGYVTQSRDGQDRPGYVFAGDRLTRGPDVPDGSVHLGRIDPTTYPYSQTAFIRTAMDAHIDPEGWKLDNAGCDRAPDIRFWEYGSTDLAGKAIDTAARLACSRLLTEAEASRWGDPGVVLGGWVPFTINAAGGAVNWTASPGHSSHDRVGLCRAGAARCLTWRTVGTGASTGDLTFPLPQAPGRYVYRYVTKAGVPVAMSNVVAQ
jgi:pectin methylesterase-like acyl-CoA thioesterase